MEKIRNFCQDGYYHIYNRGNNKQDIFLEDVDYIFYLKRLRDYKEKNNASVISYCLMPNHIHLLVKQNTEIPIYKLVSSLHTSYSMYFNKKYSKVGRLFQGRFGCKNVDKDEYLLHLSSYIHLNPLSAGLVKKLEDYQWSSYPDYIGARNGTLCDKEVIMADNSPEEYKQITEEEVADLILKKKFQNQEKYIF
ncbi:MAG: transposase [Patescibacteria group bacterium]|nr:transposase [Patescibacteria group bacterium]